MKFIEIIKVFFYFIESGKLYFKMLNKNGIFVI